MPPFDTQPPPILTQPHDSSGGFWGGLLDVLKNIPITTGDPRHGQHALGSYNDLTAGSRLMQFGRQQGLALPAGTSFSPGEAEIMVKQGLQQQQLAPLGMDTAQRLFPPQEGEGEDAMTSRALIAQTPRKDFSTILGHLMTQYGGLPGLDFGARDPAALAGAYPDERTIPVTQTPMAVPQPPSQPSAQAPTAPSTAGMVTPPARPQASYATPPAMPTPPSRLVTRQNVEAFGPVAAARLAYQQQPSAANWKAYQQAYMGAGQAILKQRDEEYREKRAGYGDTLKAWELQTAPERQAAGVGASEQAKFQAESQQPLWYTQQSKGGAGLFIDPQTLGSVDRNMPTGAAQQAVQTGQVAHLETPEQLQFLSNMKNSAVPVIQGMLKRIDRIYGDGGVFATMSPSERADVLKNGWKQFIQDNPIINEARGYFEANKIILTRLVEQGRGNIAARLIDNMEGMLPQLNASFSFDLKPPFVHFDMPDTRAVALRRMRGLTDLVDQSVGSLLNKPDFHFPWQVTWTLPEDQEGTRPGRTELYPAMPPGYKNVSGMQPSPSPFKRPPAPPPAFPGAPMPEPARTARQPANPIDARLRDAVYGQLGITQPPHAGQDVAGFERFLTTMRQELGRRYPTAPAAELDRTIGLFGRKLAQQQGATWPPAR